MCGAVRQAAAKAAKKAAKKASKSGRGNKGDSSPRADGQEKDSTGHSRKGSRSVGGAFNC